MENTKKIRELYEIYLELGHDVFEEKIKKPMEVCLHHSGSNVISINYLDTIIAKAVEKPKLGGASLNKNNFFCSSALEELFRLHNALPPICDNSNDACDILKPPEEIVPFKIPMKIIDRVMDNRYVGDGTVHPGDHLLFLHELCELFKCAGISMEKVKKKLFSMSLGGRAAHWYKLLKNRHSLGWEEIVSLFYSKFYPPSEIHQDRNSKFLAS